MKNFKQDHDTNCCAKRSILEKILIAVIVLLLCLLIALFTVFIIHLQNGKRDNFIKFEPVSSASTKVVSPSASSIVQNNKPAVCLTKQCVKSAAQILDFIDSSIDPCDDFYSFVCGNYLNKSTEVNEITPLSKLEQATLTQLDSLITDPINEPIPNALKSQRTYFTTCMNTDYDNSYTLLNLIKRLGDWPVLLERYWNANKFNWWSSMIECRNIGFRYDSFLMLSVADISNGTGPTLLSINPPEVVNVPYQFQELYIEVMANISVELGAPPNSAKEEFSRVVNFKQQLQALVEDEYRNGQHEVLKISQLEANFPPIKWKYFLNQITKTSVPFRDDTNVHVRARRYLSKLNRLLIDTPVSTQANYVVWKIIEDFYSHLNERIRITYESFLSLVDPNYSVVNNRFLYCLNKAKFYFPSVAELAYVRKYLQPHKRNDIKQLAIKIKNELVNTIKQNDWLDGVSKNEAANKVSNSKEHIGSSDQAYKDDFDSVVDMEDLYLPSDIIQMTTTLNARSTDNLFRILNWHSKDIARETLETTPLLSINAFFTHGFNTLVLPAPFLQGIIYNFQRPLYMNYGALGSIIGHEFTHSFISPKEIAEWSNEAKENYEEKVQCLLDDYKKYNGHLTEFTKNARSVLEENIANMVGPEVAYKAYQEFTRNHEEELPLPSLKYTPNQIFWIMSGVFKCYQPKLNQNPRFDENHGVPSFAVISSVKNSPYFAKDFNCPSGSNMNPYYKCRIF